MSTSRSRRSRPLVTVLAAGATLSMAAACGKHDAPASPEPPAEPVAADEDVAPAPPIAPPPMVTANPPAPGTEGTPKPPPPPGTLPTWDDVKSTHPEGATNPPRPVLQVTDDGTRCFKNWVSSMVRTPELQQIADHGGQVIASADDTTATEIVCTDDAAAVLASWKADAAE